jgi:DNA modification methylase
LSGGGKPSRRAFNRMVKPPASSIVQPVTLAWPGRSFERSTKARPRAATGSVAGTLISCETHADSQHRLILGGALDVASALLKEYRGKVQLAYIDPPYASQADYTSEVRLDGPADGRVSRHLAYGDRWNERDGGLGPYLEMLARSFTALRDLLAPEGTLWVHLDWRANYLARVLLDEVFGREGFKNEIIWRRAPNLGRQAQSAQFGRTLDTLLVYGGKKAVIQPPTRLEPIDARAVRIDEAGRPFTTAPRGDYTDVSIERLDREGRIHRTSTGKVYVKYFLTQLPDGTHARERRVDALWTDVPPLRHAPASERTGYPTQKPLALLERIIAASTQPEGLVVDLFSGSGTTALAAHRMGRRAIIGDQSPLAISTARTRLLRAGAGYRIDRLELQGLESDTLPFGSALPREQGSEGPAPLKVKAHKCPDGGWEVRLTTPEEPLAWAVDADGASSVFTCTAHAERTLGARSQPCPDVLRVASRPRAVRVYLDSGHVLETKELT